MRALPTLVAVLHLIAGGLALAQNPPSAAAGSPGKFWQASVAAETGKNYDAALQQLDAFSAAGGDPFFAHLRAGWINYLKHDQSHARASYSEAERLQPLALDPLLGLLNVAQAEADPAQILHAVDGILHVDPLNYRAQMAAATVYYQARNYRQSLAYYRRALQFYPDDLDALSGEAWALYDLGRGREAAADFQKLLAVSPDYPNGKQGLALSQAAPATQITQTL